MCIPCSSQRSPGYACRRVAVVTSPTHPHPARAVPVPSAASLPPGCNLAALSLYLRWVGHAENARIFPREFLREASAFARIIPLLGSLPTNTVVFHDAATFLYAMLAASLDDKPDGGWQYASLIAQPTNLTPLLDCIRDSVAARLDKQGPNAAEDISRFCEGIVPDNASTRGMLAAVRPMLLLLGAAGSRWTDQEDMAMGPHEQLLGATWVWDLLRLVLGTWPGCARKSVGTLVAYIAAVAERPGPPPSAEALLPVVPALHQGGLPGCACCIAAAVTLSTHCPM
jgi:hypothetical protein